MTVADALYERSRAHAPYRAIFLWPAGEAIPEFYEEVLTVLPFHIGPDTFKLIRLIDPV